MRQLLLLIVLLPLLMLTACGQKGPLFLPPPDADQTPAAEPADSDLQHQENHDDDDATTKPE